jgi:hypothetical protein
MRVTLSVSDNPADWGPAALHLHGDVLMPPFVEATVERDNEHTIKVWVAAGSDDRLGCWGVGLFQNPDLPPLTTSDLRRRVPPLNQLVDAVIERVARGPDGGRPDHDALTAAIATARRRRTEITPGRLRDVARIWRDGGTPAVRKRLHLSESQAFRLVQRARRDGYLDDVEGA